MKVVSRLGAFPLIASCALGCGNDNSGGDPGGAGGSGASGGSGSAGSAGSGGSGGSGGGDAASDAEPLPHDAFVLPGAGQVSLGIFDSQGNMVRALMQGKAMQAGQHSFEWDGLDVDGHPVAPGDYTWRLLFNEGLKAKFVGFLGEDLPGNHKPVWSLDADDTGLYLGSPGGEGNAVLQKRSLDGSVIYWGVKNFNPWHGPYRLASSGQTLFALQQDAKLLRLSRSGRLQATLDVLWPGDERPDNHYVKSHPDYMDADIAPRDQALPVLYRNSFSATGGVNVGSDPTSPGEFASVGDSSEPGQVAELPFSAAMSNEPPASAADTVLTVQADAGGAVVASAGSGSAARFAAVRDAINALPPGTYRLRLSMDYAVTDGGLWTYVQLLWYSDNDNKDSGGNDRWETGKLRHLRATPSLEVFRRFEHDYVFTLVDAGAAAPRPEGTFEVGKFTGFGLGIGLDRHGDDTSSEFRVDNIAFHGIEALPGPLWQCPVVSYQEHDAVRWIDPWDNGVRAEKSVPDPRDIAVCSDGTVLVLSQGAVVRIHADASGPLLPHIDAASLDNPVALACDAADDSLLVAQGSPSHQILRFDAAGNWVHTYGDAGGRAWGDYVAGSFQKISEIASDGQGGVLVTEGSMRHVLHLDPAGGVRNDWWGPGAFYNQAACDPADPSECYVQLGGFLLAVKVDLNTGQWQVEQVYDRPAALGLFAPFASHKSAWTCRRKNGRLYLLANAGPQTGVIEVDRDKGELHPLATCGSTKGGNYPQAWQDALSYHGYSDAESAPLRWTWSDHNRDGQAQPEEFVLGGDRGTYDYWYSSGRSFLDSDWNIVAARSHANKTDHPVMAVPNRGTAELPEWDWSELADTAHVLAVADFYGTYAEGYSSKSSFGDENGAVYQILTQSGHERPWQRGYYWPATYHAAFRMVKWNPDHTLAWKVGNLARAPRDYRHLPGLHHMPLQILGEAHGSILVHDLANTVLTAYTRDGLYAGHIFDRRADDGLPDRYYQQAWGNGVLPSDDFRCASAVEYGDEVILSANGGRGQAVMYRISGWNEWLRLEGTYPVEEAATPVPRAGSGLRGEYFATDVTSGSPDVTRIDPRLAFSWGSDSPASGVPDKGFSVRWTGAIEPEFTEYYRLYVRVDHSSRARLFVDGERLFDTDDWVKTHFLSKSDHYYSSEPILLRAGERVPIRVEYAQGGEDGTKVELGWVSPSTMNQAIPTDLLYPESGDGG